MFSCTGATLWVRAQTVVSMIASVKPSGSSQGASLVYGARKRF
ncbi:Uncharacterised protein [Mycobacteroides abscessus subsp. abscessus]|nr:Uncharacterised protein [Mycobacteroides abscessus subsp. abscessus]